MDPVKEMEEKLREAASTGNEREVKVLVTEKRVDVNSQNKMNGWTALHWASKRGYSDIASFLLKSGADKNIQTSSGQTPVQVAGSVKILELLGGDLNGDLKKDDLSITPNYIANPPFPYVSPPSSAGRPMREPSPINLTISPSNQRHLTASPDVGSQGITLSESELHPDDELVLKVRIAHAAETDFIEIEICRSQLTFENLLLTMCRELTVQKSTVLKVRKLPDTIVRKDKDVQRLIDFQELELVLSHLPPTASQPHHGMTRGYVSDTAPAAAMPTANGLKHVDVVY